jgi:hypothetical protein
MKCLVVLRSEALGELFTNEFNEGFVSVECELHFKATSGCEAVIKDSTGPLHEFEWRDKDITYGSYESLLIFRLEKLEYTVGAGCGSSGTNGEYDGSISLDGVIVK